MERLHRPVLLREVIEYIRLNGDGVYADLTFGEAGHSDAFLERGIKFLVGNDRDKSTLDRYRSQGKFKDDPRLRLVEGPFSEFVAKTQDLMFDGILVDLGVSTRQLLEAERGFSLMKPGPLDMRMNPGVGEPLSAWLQHLTEEELADQLYYNAELRDSRRLAKKIMRAYREGKLTHTVELAQLAGPKIPGKSHPATALFTALRMMVNQEREEMETAIPQLIDRLKPGGRLLVITFHSTEDRIIKKMFLKAAGRCVCSEPICRCPKSSSVRLITKKPVEASHQELEENPRARSAKLRCVEKI
ncbi:MAG: 16S rRNA (cytosine(1402)-N(4))-methyltransferase RsmH [Deltaproteobacteria bacterium]